ncbi:MAG: enoyl-CoA hydratase/isomerase family protein [Planctomycetes bacterium]|nr:enoyl-CoA hydratase/isomerase family protein [Planctomycetota bacterium]
MIDVNIDERLAVVKMDRGITNPLNLEFVKALEQTFEQLKTDPLVRAMVLTSANEKFFSIGLDIPSLIELSPEEFGVFFKAFNDMCMTLYTFPKPAVAGITGHAIAGGCILALCCDYRVIGEGRKLMGLNEIKLGVQVPFLAHCILESLVGTGKAREIVELGEFYPTEQTLRMGMVDQAWPSEEVLLRSIVHARKLCAFSQEAFWRIKQNRIESVESRVRPVWEKKQKQFVECWFSHEARKNLRAAMETF